MWPDKCWAEWDNDLLVSAGDALVGATQHPVGCLCHSSTLFTYIEFIVHQEPQVPFHRAAVHLGRSQPVPHCWIMFCQVQVLTFSLLNFIRLLLAHSSSLSRSSCRVALPSEASTSLLTLISLAKFIRVHLVPSSRSLMKWYSTAFSPISIPGGPHMWQVASLKRSHLPPPSGCALSASFPPKVQTTCLDHNASVSLGGGCGKPCWKP